MSGPQTFKVVLLGEGTSPPWHSGFLAHPGPWPNSRGAPSRSDASASQCTCRVPFRLPCHHLYGHDVVCTASRAIHQTLGLTLTLTCGDAGRVGKTSLVLRYVQNTFNDAQPATIQASYLTKRLTVENKTINLAIWVRGASLSSPLRWLCVSGWSCATQCRVWPYMHPPDTYASPPAINLFPRGFVHPVR